MFCSFVNMKTLVNYTKYSGALISEGWNRFQGQRLLKAHANTCHGLLEYSHFEKNWQSKYKFLKEVKELLLHENQISKNSNSRD